MHVRTSELDVSQTGSSELAQILRIACHLKSSRVLVLRTNSDVVERVVGEEISRVTYAALNVVEDSAATLLGGGQCGDARIR